jgi:methionine synthase I (cobalamin-dependent)/5,10-methylenetetrahydrofolate reductase
MPKTSIIEFIRDRVAVVDGGTGTELYSRGIFINRCYDELNLSMGKLVKEVHERFVQAGCNVLETNTFGANRYKLDPHGVVDKLDAINYQGAKLAREVGGDDVYVSGAVGPLGIRIEPWGPTSVDEAREAFREQMEALNEGKVDLFAIEGFQDLAEMHQAILAARDVNPDLPVLAVPSINLQGELSFGTPPEIYAPRLDEWGVDIIGLMGAGPRPMLSAIERIRPLTKKPLCAMPDAGLPQQVEGRSIYLASPEYMSTYARHFVAAGCNMVGGESGVTPEFIRAMRQAIRADAPGKTAAEVARELDKRSDELEPAPEIKVVPTAKKSRFARRICDGEFVSSIEITPPRGSDPTKILEKVQLLKDAGVDAVNVPDGPRAAARMGAAALAIIIEQQVGIEAVLHYCCRDRNMLGMMSDLLGLYGVGLRNILVITGDPPKMGDYPDSTAVFDVDAIGLTNIVYGLNHGYDPGHNPLKDATGWHIGVGVNPGAIDMEREMSRYDWKIKAGAEYAITQPVFDLDQLKAFLDRAAALDKQIPVIAGVWPLVSYRNAEFMNNEVPGVVVPEPIMQRMAKAQEGGKEAALQEGLTIAQEMAREIKDLVQGIQVSAPFGRVKFAIDVLDAVR